MSLRRTLFTGVVDLLLYVNIEYKVDQRRRDMKILELVNQEGIGCTFIHDKLLVEPGTLFTQQGKPFAVNVPRVLCLAGSVSNVDIKGRRGIRDRRAGTPRTFPDEVTWSKVNARRRTSARRMNHFPKVKGVLNERYCG